MNDYNDEYKSPFEDKRIVLIYIIVIVAILTSVTYALQSTSIAFNVTTGIIMLDEDAYGDTSFDSSDIDMVPILDSEVEERLDNVIKIDFTVGGNELNNAENIIYDIALVDLNLDCNLLSEYFKWKLVKDGEEVSSGSFSYKFDTIKNGRLVLTNPQFDLPEYSATEVGYHDFTFYIWLSDSCQEDLKTCKTNGNLIDQSDLMGKYFKGKIEVELYTESKKDLVRTPVESIPEGTCISNYVPNTFALNIMKPNAKSDASIDFSKTSEQSGTNGIYVRNDTINDPYPIYYYRGSVDNNLIFAGFCWKIVRTTETGGLKLIYNGSPTNGQCNNTGTATQIGTKAFNTSKNSPAYVGYMYGDVYTNSSKSLSSDTNEYIYSNSVSYANGTYTLTGATTSGPWSSVYNQLSNTHYTCFSTSTTCDATSGKVYYVYYTSSSTAYYISLNGEASVEVALSNMLDKNTTSSTIKGSATTSGTLDYWYANNITGTDYESYVEDTVWCNDRSIYSLGGWNPDEGTTSSNYYLYFSGYNRAYTTYTPDLTCTRAIDKFTVSEANGNGDLDYPVGLLTSDEIMLAGGLYGTSNSSYYLYTGQNYWVGSPYNFSSNLAYGFSVYSTGYLNRNIVYNAYGVRPSISLKRGFTIVGDGTGSTENPYVVE